MGRLWAIIIKELWSVLRDPRSRITLIAPPVLQLFLFGFATTLEVKHFDVGVLDLSGGPAAFAFEQRLAASPNVRKVIRLRNRDDLRQAVETQSVIAAAVIDERFDREVARNRPARIGLILDGRRSNAAQIVSGYISQIAAEEAPAGVHALPPPVVVRALFNPNLDYLWFTMPSLVVLIGAVSALTITAQSIARERELGTYEQLLVSPLRTNEILLGKMTPPFLAGMVNGTLYLTVSTLLFGVPYTGALWLFFPALALYLLSLIGVGMLVSTLARTQQQAFLGVFTVTIPVTILSGYAAPIDNMPPWLQLVSLADPCRHFLVVVEGLFLKAVTPIMVLQSAWPLAVIAAVTLSASGWLFRARKE